MHSPLGVAGSVLICGIRCSTRLNFVTFICRHVPERFSCDVSGFDVCVLMCLLSWRDVVSCLWHDFYIQIFGVYIYTCDVGIQHVLWKALMINVLHANFDSRFVL